jgi:hypothetical protein
MSKKRHWWCACSSCSGGTCIIAHRSCIFRHSSSHPWSPPEKSQRINQEDEARWMKGKCVGELAQVALGFHLIILQSKIEVSGTKNFHFSRSLYSLR